MCQVVDAQCYRPMSSAGTAASRQSWSGAQSKNDGRGARDPSQGCGHAVLLAAKRSLLSGKKGQGQASQAADNLPELRNFPKSDQGYYATTYGLFLNLRGCFGRPGE